MSARRELRIPRRNLAFCGNALVFGLGNFCKAKANRCAAARAAIATFKMEKEENGISSRSWSGGDDGIVRHAHRTLAEPIRTVNRVGDVSTCLARTRGGRVNHED